MGINRATEYSIRALIYMAMNSNVEVITKEELCKTQDVTPGFLTKIMQPLIKSGIVKSFRGAKGGFQLAVSPRNITLYEIITGIDDVLFLNDCLVHDGACERDQRCFMHTIWDEAMGGVKDTLQKYTLAEVARQQVKLLSLIANGN
jgi:Rrf2 family protein